MSSVRAHSKLLKFTPQVYLQVLPPHLKLSLMADQVLADIQNCSSLLKFTCKFYPPPIEHRSTEYD